MKKAQCGGNFVNYSGLLSAIEANQNDSSIDPFFLTHHILDAFYGGEGKVKLDRLGRFFGHFATYFEEDDYQFLLNEAQFMGRGTNSVQITELASMIRDDVELF